MSKQNPPKEPKFSWLYRILNWPRVAIRRMYAWTMKWGDSPQAEKALFGISFSESSFFPIPPDPLLIAMVTANTKKWFRLAVITTSASVLGAVLGYLIGFALFESIGQAIVSTYGLESEFQTVGERYDENAFLAVLIAGFTPIPFKVFTLAGGLFQINLLTLIFASILGRGARFGAVSWMASILGAKYRDKIERYIDILGFAFLAVLTLGFVAIRYVM